MSKDVIGSLGIDLELMSAKFERGINTANGHLNKLSKTATAANKIFGALLVAGGGAAFSGLVKSSLDAANRLGDLSARLGVTVEGLSRLEYAAKLTGVSSNTLATGLQRMTRRVAEAANGSGEAIGALNELGLSAEKLKQLRPEQQFEVLADALEAVPEQSDKVRLGMKLLDSEGVALLQTMKGGSEAIRAMGEESDKTGNTISTKFAQQATAANAAMIKLSAASVGLTNSLVSGLGPTIEQIAHFLGDVTPKAGQLAAEALDKMRSFVTALAAEIAGVLERTAKTAATIAGFLGADEVAQSLQNTADMYKGMKTELYDLSTVYSEATYEVEKFGVEIGKNVVNIADFRGETESLTESNKKLTESIKEAKEAEKLRGSALTKFDSIRDSLLSVEQAEKESHDRRLGQIAFFEAQYPNLKALANQVAEEEKARHEKALSDIEKKEVDKRTKLAEIERRNRFGVAKGMFGNLSTLMNTESKKLFEIGKTAAIASAVVSGFEAVVHSYKEGAKIGGPPLGAAFAATAAVATAAQIQSIKSQQFGGGGTVSAGTSGGAGPGVYQPPQPAIPGGAGDGGRGVQIVFNGSVGNIDDAEKLAELLADHIETSDAIIVSDTSRNGQLLRAG